MRTDISCETAPSRVYEVPAGPTNGVNRSYSVAIPPSTDHPLSLFCNGTPLVRGVDFDVNGRILTLSVAATPRPGDLLKVVYTPVAGTTRQQQPHADPFVPGSPDQDLTFAAAKSALQTEVQRAFPLSQLGDTSVETVARQHSEGAESNLISIQLLRDKLTDTPNSHDDKFHRALQGVDGLGDDAMSSVFADPKNAHLGEQKTRAVPTTLQKVSVGVAPTAQALTMLKRKLGLPTSTESTQSPDK